MLPTRTLFEFWGQLFGTTAPLQAADGDQPVYKAIKADFTPSLDLVVGGLTLSDGLDFDFKEVVPEDTGHGVDPLNGDKRIIHQINPGGGSKPWFESLAPAIGTSVYGVAMINQDTGALLGTHKFDAPIAITRTKQMIDMPEQAFRLPTSMVR